MQEEMAKMQYDNYQKAKRIAELHQRSAEEQKRRQEARQRRVELQQLADRFVNVDFPNMFIKMHAQTQPQAQAQGQGQGAAVGKSLSGIDQDSSVYADAHACGGCGRYVTKKQQMTTLDELSNYLLTLMPRNTDKRVRQQASEVQQQVVQQQQQQGNGDADADADVDGVDVDEDDASDEGSVGLEEEQCHPYTYAEWEGDNAIEDADADAEDEHEHEYMAGLH